MLEWIGERYNPGELGEVTFGGGEIPKREKAVVVIRLIFALALLGGWIWLLAGPIGVDTLKWWTISGGLTVMYLTVAWHVRPEADMDNIGWAGGFFDHPFRWSDDWNRTLIWMRILLWPGLFISESLLDAPSLLRKGPVLRKRKRRRRPKPPQSGSVFHESNEQ
jgi:hypothetical protein